MSITKSPPYIERHHAMSLINTKIKPFSTTAFHDGEFVDVSDADPRASGRSSSSIPADFTFVCPTELGDLADNYADFQSLGVEIYSVSTDTHFAHKAWHDTSDTIGKIQYPMLGDPTLEISTQLRRAPRGPGPGRPGHLPRRPRRRHPVHRDRPPRASAATPAELLRKVKAAQYVACAPGRGLPGEVGRGRRHPRPVARPRRQDLTGRIESGGRASARSPTTPPRSSSLASLPPSLPPSGATPCSTPP